MAIRANHYDAAFEGFLRSRRIPYVAVDEQRRALLEEQSLKSMDFIVYSRQQRNLLIDVKGRRFPSGGTESGHKWENWATAEDLPDARFPVFAAGRGGQWTYHGPGQRTAYVMLDLTRPHGTVPARDIRAYVHGLEEWLIRALDRFNVRAERREGRVGIWVQRGTREDKIAALGVRIKSWVSFHGVALNMDPDLLHFTGIVPCGVKAHGVTSLADLGIVASMADVDVALKRSFGKIFG